MVLAVPPPVDLDDVNVLTRNIFNGSLSNCICIGGSRGRGVQGGPDPPPPLLFPKL